MNKEFISYKHALALDLLEFDEPCFGYYYTTNGPDWKFAENNEFDKIDKIDAEFSMLVPTYSQAFRFFRDNYDYHHYIEPIHRDGKVQYEYCVVDSSDDAKEFNEDCIVSTYEEAELECLNLLIEIAKY
jgi:hypothetical protein